MQTSKVGAVVLLEILPKDLVSFKDWAGPILSQVSRASKYLEINRLQVCDIRFGD
jgi:hypothetical protein